VPPTGHLDLTLLGPVELRRSGVPVDVPPWRRHRVRSLLAHLALHRPVSRERLGADLWPEMDADAQSHNLRVTLSHLLRVLEPDRGERDASFLVRPQGGNGLLLHGGEWLDVDVWRFDALWTQASDADRAGVPSRALAAMRQAVDLWRDDPTELALQDWALPDVEERRLRLVQMAARAGELLLAHDDPEEARRMGQAALRGDPWCERAHHVVVAAHLAAGQHRAARDALERYREALAELGLSPTESARKLEPLEVTALTVRGR
jgi:DNA-binding SARP family transcriptional activator